VQFLCNQPKIKGWKDHHWQPLTNHDHPWLPHTKNIPVRTLSVCIWYIWLEYYKNCKILNICLAIKQWLMLIRIYFCTVQYVQVFSWNNQLNMRIDSNYMPRYHLNSLSHLSWYLIVICSEF
jgi:hypothetical protein